MSRTSRTSAMALLALLALGCAEEAQESEDTSGTTRALLNTTTQGGPSSPGGGDEALAGGVARAFIPELGYNYGSEDAPLKVIEFADFGCGYCRLFHQETLPTLLEEFVDTEQIEWKVMTFVSGQFDNSLAITEGAECVLEQDRDVYEALTERIWEGQAEWKPSDEPDVLVRSWADGLGVDMERYDACTAEDRQMQRIAGATAVSRQLGVQGTPTFWLVGYGPLQGALPLDVFREILTAVMAEVELAAANADEAN